MAAVPNQELPRTKRTACVVCRKRKTACDGYRPECTNCSKLGYECHYETSRKRSGPRPGYVKQLESRLERLENEANSGGSTIAANRFAYGLDAGVVDPGFLGMNGMDTRYSLPSEAPQLFSPPQMLEDEYMAEVTDFMMTQSFGQGPPNLYTPTSSAQNSNGIASNESGGKDIRTWLDTTGLQEPLPPQEMIDELEEGYFSILHKSFPILHKKRYLMSTRFPSKVRPEICLRYAMWASAAAVMPKYSDHKMIFYRRARDYVDQVEMRVGFTDILSASYLQATILICVFEYKTMLLGRALLTAAKAARVATILNLSRIDSNEPGRKKTLSEAEDFIELEERRRTFWGAFTCDRFDQPWTGWSCYFNDANITTNLPCNEEAFENGTEEKSFKMKEILSHDCSKLSSFAGHLITVALSNKIINLALQAEEENLKDIDSPWWKTYEWLNDILVRFQEALPRHLRLPDAMDHPDVVSVNLSLQANIIGLHYHVCRKSDELGLDDDLTVKAKHRSMEAAAHISTIVRMYGNRDSKHLHPFSCLTLITACRLYAFAVADDPNDTLAQGSLDYLTEFMKREASHNSLPTAFLVHLGRETEIYKQGKHRSDSDSAVSKWIENNSSESPESTGRQTQEGLSDGRTSTNEISSAESNNSSSNNGHWDNSAPSTRDMTGASAAALDSSKIAVTSCNGFSTKGQYSPGLFNDNGTFPLSQEGFRAFLQGDSPTAFPGLNGEIRLDDPYLS